MGWRPTSSSPRQNLQHKVRRIIDPGRWALPNREAHPIIQRRIVTTSSVARPSFLMMVLLVLLLLGPSHPPAAGDPTDSIGSVPASLCCFDAHDRHPDGPCPIPPPESREELIADEVDLDQDGTCSIFL